MHLIFLQIHQWWMTGQTKSYSVEHLQQCRLAVRLTRPCYSLNLTLLEMNARVFEDRFSEAILVWSKVKMAASLWARSSRVFDPLITF
ncbi:hypothetical protein LguiB_024088 [Lonicera macranthoides]